MMTVLNLVVGVVVANRLEKMIHEPMINFKHKVDDFGRRHIG